MEITLDTEADRVGFLKLVFPTKYESLVEISKNYNLEFSQICTDVIMILERLISPSHHDDREVRILRILTDFYNANCSNPIPTASSDDDASEPFIIEVNYKFTSPKYYTGEANEEE